MWEVVLTNLDRKNYPLHRIKELYHWRWGIETSFKKLKYSLGSVEFHSKQDKFIEMEIYAHMIMFNEMLKPIFHKGIASTNMPSTLSNHALLFKACILILLYLRLLKEF